jgi:hypothetical protein
MLVINAACSGRAWRTKLGAIRRFVPKHERYTAFTGAFPQGFPQKLWMHRRLLQGI